jgi:hypothetical protein
MGRGRQTEIDWREIKRRLMHGSMKLRPWEIQRMTFAEIVLALDEDVSKPRPPSGSYDLSAPGAKQAHHEWLRSLNLEERLDAYAEGLL